MRPVLGATKQIDLHSTCQNLKSLHRGLNWVQSRWSQQHIAHSLKAASLIMTPTVRTMGRMYIQRSADKMRCLHFGQNVHSEVSGQGEVPPFAWAQTEGLPAVTSSQQPLTVFSPKSLQRKQFLA